MNEIKCIKLFEKHIPCIKHYFQGGYHINQDLMNGNCCDFIYNKDGTTTFIPSGIIVSSSARKEITRGWLVSK